MQKQKNSRALIAGVVATAVLGTSVAILPQFATADDFTVTATTALNVRADRSTSSQILGVLATGEQVERRGDPVGEWTPVKYRGQDAWVFSAFANVTYNAGASGNYALTGSAAGGTATANDDVHVRSSASTLSRSYGILRNGQQVSVTGAAKGGWVPVNWNGKDAWIYGVYLNSNAVDAANSPAQAAAAPAEVAAAAPNAATGSATATTAVNVRAGASTSTQVLTVLRTGQSIEVTGEPQNGWTPVLWNGQNAFVFSQYLRTGAGAAGSPAVEAQDVYTTDHVNLRTGPGLGYQVVRVLPTNTKITLTGTTQDSWSQVDDGGTLRWISTAYLADQPVTVRTSATAGSAQGPAAPANGAAAGTLNFGGSSGLDQIREGAKIIVREVRQKYPQINTIYGWRHDPLPDHPSGRAIDIMMPRGANDAELGNEIAAWLQANADRLDIEYLIWRQQIWINGQGSGWTWMADRGSITANHYDHIHITING